MRKKKFRIATTRVQFALPMIFTLIIGLITAADYFYWQHSYLGSALWEIITLFSCFVALMLLDMVDMIVFPHQMPNAIQTLLFVSRVVLIGFIQYLDISKSALSLLGLIPYYTFFTYGGVISIMFTILLLCYFYTLLPEIGPGITTGVANLLFLQILSFFMSHTHNITLHNRKLLQELHLANTELQLVADEIAELSAFEERMRLSRDLHDSVGHHLTAISIQLEKAVAYQEISKEDSVEAVNNARQAAGKALQEVRQFISTLKNMHYEFDFNEKTKALIDSFRQENFQVDWEISGNQELYPLHTQRNLYHALQELLTNIQKHAEATRIRINVKFTRKEAILQVEDNGIGFNPRKALRQDGHFGLKHIRERTNLLNGTLEIRADSQNGSTIEICVPRER